MKTFQIKLKTVLFLIVIGLAFASCRNGKDGDATDIDSDSNLEQVNPSTVDDGDARSPNSSQDSNTSITLDSDAISPDSPEGNEAPITIDCNYFQKNPNTILKKKLL